MRRGGTTARLFGAAVRPLQAFLRLEAASGILLLLAAVVAFVWANSSPDSYRAVFEYPLALGAGEEVAQFTLRDFINDGLMAVFFFVVGMEIKRELVVGELNSMAKATLPIIAAVGGMVLPAGIFLAFNLGTPGQRGWGIPMATDIAFCIGILTLLRNRIPHALIVFITALAIFDDIGGILVIALFYGDGIHLEWLLAAAGLMIVLSGLGRALVSSGLVYFLLGVLLWLALHHAGIHATIAGVLLGLMIPARARRPARQVLVELDEHVSALRAKSSDAELENAEVLMIEEKLEELQAPLNRFVHALHGVVAFAIMPLFAVANAGVTVTSLGLDSVLQPVALGTALGLFLGKQLGIFSFTLLAVKLRVAPMPGDATHRQLFGVSVVAGIGFTVALFIASLAFRADAELLDQAKVGILLGSLAAGLAGYALLRAGGRQPLPTSESS